MAYVSASPTPAVVQVTVSSVKLCISLIGVDCFVLY